MGNAAFTNHITSIQDCINILNNTATTLERKVTALTARSEGGGPDAEEAESIGKMWKISQPLWPNRLLTKPHKTIKSGQNISPLDVISNQIL